MTSTLELFTIFELDMLLDDSPQAPKYAALKKNLVMRKLDLDIALDEDTWVMRVAVNPGDNEVFKRSLNGSSLDGIVEHVCYGTEDYLRRALGPVCSTCNDKGVMLNSDAILCSRCNGLSVLTKQENAGKILSEVLPNAVAFADLKKSSYNFGVKCALERAKAEAR